MNDRSKQGIQLTLFIVILAFVILMTVIIISLHELFGRDIPAVREEPQAFHFSANESTALPSFSPPAYFSYYNNKDENGNTKIPPAFAEMLFSAFRMLQEDNLVESEDLLRTLYLYYPESPTVMRMLGGVLYSEKKYMEAERLFLKLCLLYSEDPVLLNNLAMTQGMTGKFPEAIKNMRKVMQLAPDIETNELNLAGLFLKAGKKEEAIQSFREAHRKLGRKILCVRGNPVFEELMKNEEVLKILETEAKESRSNE